MPTLLDLPLTYEPPAPRIPEMTRSDEIQCRLDAEADVLADVDTFTDWLYSKCIGNKPEHTRFGYIPSSKVNLGRFVESLDVPQLVAAQLKPHAELAGLASWELRQRYLADPETQQRIERIAAQKVAEWSAS